MGAQVQWANMAKFLGLIIDTKLTWREQIETVYQKINRFVFALQKLNKIANKKTATMAYFAHVESIM
jgi:catabolite regulation protein CreA